MLQIDWDFVSFQEGGRRSIGYVPEVGNSGVTVATGIDIGSMTDEDFNSLPAELQNKLRRYRGLHRAVAQAMLDQYPLHLSMAEMIALEQPVRRDLVAGMVENYHRDSGEDFEQLPPAAQTVIADVTWQYGCPWAHEKCPRFWALCCARNWPGVYHELMNFGDAYTDRRHAEAIYLQAHLPLDVPVPTPRP